MSGILYVECMALEDDALHLIRKFFVESREFNGIPASRLAERLGLVWSDAQRILEHIVAGGNADLAFATYSGNPHIKRLADLPVEVQLSKLAADDPAGICVYPNGQFLRQRGDFSEYDDRPYTRRLALAEAQLTPVFFELRVLEQYFRDPRYHCRFWDRSGFISVREDHYQSAQMAERDKVLLETFGIGYDRERNRVVLVFLRYLADLSPEHQQIWRAHEVGGPCTINSDYERASIWGQWAEFHSVYEAFIQEQIEINRLCDLIGKPPLFQKTFEEEQRPIGFAPMLRPTRGQYHEFAHTLDRMLGDNVNRKFFEGDVPLEDRIIAGDGSIERRRLGTITLLERWFNSRYRDANGKNVAREVMSPWRDIRDVRNAPAHALGNDQYGLEFPRKQDELLGNATRSLTKLRLALSSHPNARGYEAPKWLDGDDIVFY